MVLVADGLVPRCCKELLGKLGDINSIKAVGLDGAGLDWISWDLLSCVVTWDTIHCGVTHCEMCVSVDRADNRSCFILRSCGLDSFHVGDRTCGVAERRHLAGTVVDGLGDVADGPRKLGILLDTREVFE